MNGPWQPHLQLGVVHFMAFPECLAGEGPQLDTLAAICHDPFFDAVDVGPVNDPTERKQCADLLRDCQMTVTFACQPVQLQRHLDLNSPDRAKRRLASDTVIGLIDQANALGASRFALMSGKNVSSADRSAALGCLVNELCRVCREAR